MMVDVRVNLTNEYHWNGGKVGLDLGEGFHLSIVDTQDLIAEMAVAQRENSQNADGYEYRHQKKSIVRRHYRCSLLRHELYRMSCGLYLNKRGLSLTR